MNETSSPYDVWAAEEALKLVEEATAQRCTPSVGRCQEQAASTRDQAGAFCPNFRCVQPVRPSLFEEWPVRIWAARKSRTGSPNQLLASNTLQNFNTRNTGVGNADRIYAWLCPKNLY
jgi:hypothetical protein